MIDLLIRPSVRAFSRTASVFAMLVAASVVCGWALNITMLTSVLPGLVAMNPMTATGFFLAGAALWLLSDPNGPARFRLAGRACAAATLVLGASRLIGYLTPWDPALDQFLFADMLQNVAYGPNRMAPNTAMNFVCIAAALLLIDVETRRGHRPAQLIVLGAAAISLLALTAYSYQAVSFLDAALPIPMALHTAVTFIVLAAGILAARPDRGVMKLVRGATAGSVTARRLLIAAVIVPLLIGLVAVTVEHAGLVNSNLGVAIQTVANTLILAAIIWWHTRALHRTDTDRLRAETERDRFFVLSVDMLCVIDADGFFRRINPAWARTLGHSIADLTSTPFIQFVHPDDRAATQEQMRKLAWGTDTVSFENRCRCLDGTYRWLSWVACSMPEAHLNFAAARDITDARQTQEKLKAYAEDLERSNAALAEAKAVAEAATLAKSSFLAHMSHEIRTPLNGVTGMTDMLLKTNLTDRQRRYVELTRSSARSLTTLINNVLDFSKIEAGKLDLEPREFNLPITVEDVVVLLAQKAVVKNVEVVCHVEPRVPRLVSGDPDRLRQVLTNLINNAIKFTGAGEVVVLVTCGEETGSEATIRFAVIDTGIGIPPDRMNRLFQPFTQVDASTTRHFGGTGLGLVIARQLVELMGGRIGVESEPGRGSTFWCTIPFSVAEEPSPQKPTALTIIRDLRVLAVDENPVTRDVLLQQVRSWGLEAAAAMNESEAINLLTAAMADGTPYRVAIIDGDLKEAESQVLARRIKTSAELSETVLMILVSMDSEISPEVLKARGFDGHMTKPVRQSLLFDTIMNAVASSAGPAVKAATDSAPVRAVAPDLPRPTPPPGRAHILIAEDNEINRIVAGEILTEAGYTCDVVVDGQQAVDAVRTRRYDLLLMDCQMPLMDGFEATRAIRLHEQADEREGRLNGHLPIVALTANAIRGDRERCIEAGMDGYVSKPIDPDRLLDTIEAFLRGPEEQFRPDVNRETAQAPPSAPAGNRDLDGANGDPMNPEILLDRCMKNTDAVERILTRFVEQATLDLERIERCAREGDSEQLARTAHGLKGAAGILTAADLARITSDIEEIVREGSIEDAAQHIDRLRREVDRCVRYLPKLRASIARHDHGATERGGNI